MSEIIVGKHEVDQAAFCPKCVKPQIDYSVLDGGGASCRACGWEGRRGDLLIHAFKQDLGSADQVMGLFVQDVAMSIKNDAFIKSMTKLLAKWGFIDLEHGGKEAQKEIIMYLKALVVAMVASIIDTRDRILRSKADA